MCGTQTVREIDRQTDRTNKQWTPTVHVVTSFRFFDFSIDFRLIWTVFLISFDVLLQTLAIHIQKANKHTTWSTCKKKRCNKLRLCRLSRVNTSKCIYFVFSFHICVFGCISTDPRSERPCFWVSFACRRLNTHDFSALCIVAFYCVFSPGHAEVADFISCVSFSLLFVVSQAMAYTP